MLLNVSHGHGLACIDTGALQAVVVKAHALGMLLNVVQSAGGDWWDVTGGTMVEASAYMATALQGFAWPPQLCAAQDSGTFLSKPVASLVMAAGIERTDMMGRGFCMTAACSFWYL